MCGQNLVCVHIIVAAIFDFMTGRLGTVEIVKTFARPKITPAMQVSRGLNVRKSACLKGMMLLIRVLVKALSSYPKLTKSTFHLSEMQASQIIPFLF